MDLRSLRDVEVADVVKGDRRAATLRRVEDGVVFDYLDEYRRDRGPAVALTLPVTEETVITKAGALPAFFSGLLPEGRRLAALRDVVKTSLDDELSLLLAVGSDPIGDVRVLPSRGVERAERPDGLGGGGVERAELPEPGPAYRGDEGPAAPVVSWSEGASISFREVLADAGMRERRGMAGFQDKVSAAMITLPATSGGRDAILKLTPPEFPYLVENEAWFLALARSAGLPVPRFHLVTDAVGERGLLIERFDRGAAAGRPQRRAVEDAAQVLGIYPADKYRVSTEQVAAALIAPCRAARVAARDVFRQVVFAWLTGNGDLHAKNLSIVQGPDTTGERRANAAVGEWRIAPVYDVPSTLPYGDETMALKVSGRDHDLSRKALLKFADSIDLPAVAATRELDQLLVATEPAVEVFREQAEPFARLRQSKAVAQLQHRRRLLQP